MKRSRSAIVLLAAIVVLLAVPAAGAKDFRPGDLRVCGRVKCVAIVNPQALRLLSAYYYGSTVIRRAPRVRPGAKGFELRFRNGYATGMVATARLDRFRSYGVVCGRFVRGKWYRFPARAALELGKLTAGLKPLRVPLRPPGSC